MRKLENAADLKQAMAELNARADVKKQEIKAEFSQVKENLQFKNVIKNTYSRLAETPEIQRTVVNTAVGMVLGYATNLFQKILREDSLNRLTQNIVHTQLDKIERKDPNSKAAKILSLVRTNIPHDSTLHPFLGYKRY
ncbi:MAG: hypothetical protein JWQ96_844 [Segetibacter sp.]|nr:hypothetical protein [Segetibacter sp.]